MAIFNCIEMSRALRQRRRERTTAAEGAAAGWLSKENRIAALKKMDLIFEIVDS